ncbi:MAG: aldo/keto reductase [Ardenticatenaceae bacterium]|nr:aldo/keto reductase [Anaerolineales bacterium]MCB8921727.1 aldo/keto reductase [Ardenticatenaceae bacterium]MCB8990754.1 aldo/keto reductase [Ardenticatenaceae bacterium]MCB9003241.1 aldo/keto reductase [Ardenticatenaceae bacterium]
MEYRQLGNSGVRVSVIGMGTNQFGGPVDQDGVNRVIGAAQELGINLIDTADVYQNGRSEETLGHALKGKWDNFVVATKVYFKTGDRPNDYGASRYHIMNGVEASLRRLQSDHIDLYQMHRWDATTPIQETMRTLDDLVSSGKVRYIGASAYAAWQLAKANLLAEFQGWASFVTVQSHYHMLEREVEKEVIPYCQEHNVGFIPYFPLAGGFLTGKYRRESGAPAGSRGERSSYVQAYMTDANFTIVETLSAWAEERGHTMAELAHAWLLAQPTVCSVISGLTKLEHLQANAKAADWALTAVETAEVNAILKGDDITA